MQPMEKPDRGGRGQWDKGGGRIAEAHGAGGRRYGAAEERSGAAAQMQVEIGNSRLSAGQIYRMVQSFSQFKKDLISAIGFGGMLSLPHLHKLNLKFSLWLLNRVDVNSQALVIDDDRMIRFFEEDVEKVFGIPCGPRKIDGPDGSVTQESVGFMRAALGLVDKDSHSLKRIEAILQKDVSENSSRLEQECFQIAFVIYCMGHLFAPSGKHDYVTVDYWGALKSADHIVHYNWCEYVIRNVVDAARKVQSAKGQITIPGCHLFLQIFFLDNMDVGSFKMPHRVFPRISEFDSERIRVMIQKSVRCDGGEEMFAIARVRVAESVCYKRCMLERSMSRGEPATPNWRVQSKQERVHAPPSVVHDQPEQFEQQVDAHTPYSMEGFQQYAIVELDIGRFLSPSGYFEYLKLKYPDIVGSHVMDLLKRHNAKCVKHYINHQRAIIKENMMLADALVDALGEDRIKAAERGRTASGGSKGVGDSLVGLRLNFDQVHEAQGESSLSRSQKSESRDSTIGKSLKRSGPNSGDDVARGKRILTEGSASVSSGRTRSLDTRDDMPSFDLGIDEVDKVEQTQCPPGAAMPPAIKSAGTSNQSPRSANKNFSELIIGEMLVLQSEKKTTPVGKVLFGDATPKPIPRRKLLTGDFAPNPFYNGHVHRRPTPEAMSSLFVWLTSQNVKDIDRTWIMHHYPRHIELTGDDIQKQLIGNESMDPDVFSLLVRRFAQLDAHMMSGHGDLRWRHFMDPDFAAFALAGSDVGQLLSVQNQFIGDGVTYNLARAEMFVVPAKLITGWACYMWDMKRRIIHALDPLNLLHVPDGRRAMHEDVTGVLHSWLSRCLWLYFDDFVISDTPWPRIFPVLGRKNFSEQESGVVAAYLSRNYDGKRVEIPLDEEGFKEAQKRMLFDALQLEGNMATLPDEVVTAMSRFE